MNLLPIAQRLEDNSLGVQAETIFINMIPAECPQGILLRNKLEGTKIDHELPGFYRSKFQLIVRAKSYAEGEQLIKDATVALTLTEQKLDGMSFRYIRPLTLPVVFPLSKGNLLEFSADFETAFNE